MRNLLTTLALLLLAGCRTYDPTTMSRVHSVGVVALIPDPIEVDRWHSLLSLGDRQKLDLHEDLNAVAEHEVIEDLRRRRPDLLIVPLTVDRTALRAKLYSTSWVVRYEAEHIVPDIVELEKANNLDLVFVVAGSLDPNRHYRGVTLVFDDRAAIGHGVDVRSDLNVSGMNRDGVVVTGWWPPDFLWKELPKSNFDLSEGFGPLAKPEMQERIRVEAENIVKVDLRRMLAKVPM